MTTKRTAREFWINPDPFMKKGTGHFMHFAHTGLKELTPEFIHVREVMPDEISDTERFEFINTSDLSLIHQQSGSWIVHSHLWGVIGRGNTLREAIDAAIREGKKNEKSSS